MSVEQKAQSQETPGQAEGPSWMQAPSSTLALSRVPSDQLFGALAKDPSRIDMIVQTRPAMAASLLQRALVENPELAARISQAIGREFRRSAGMGDSAQAMFRAALALEGPGSVAVRAEMENLVNERDAGMQEPVLSKLQRPLESDEHALLERTSRDPEFGKLYQRFFDDPVAAAQMLHELSNKDPSALEQRTHDLRSMFQRSPAAAERFVHAVEAISDPTAVLLKAYVVRELYEAMAPEQKAIGVIDKAYGSMRTQLHIRAERLVPLLAEIVSKPDVAQALVRFEHAHDERPPGIPDLHTLLTSMLRASYAEAVQVSVRNSITQGGAEMLTRSATADSQAAGDDWARNAGTLLGDAARAQAEVGIEQSMVENVRSKLELVGKFAPGTGGKAMRTIASLLAFVPDDQPDLEWTRQTVDSLLSIIYTGVHGGPPGQLGSKEHDAWDIDFNAWREHAAQGFLNEYRG